MKFVLAIVIGLISIYLQGCKDAPKPIYYGSLEGNVFWKYNNYVGNKPDAGARVNIFGITDTSYRETVNVDLRGDFRIDSIPEGEYLVITKSVNTTNNPRDHVASLYYASPYLISLCPDFDTAFIVNAMARIREVDRAATNALIGSESTKGLKEYDQLTDSVNNMARRFLEEIPESVQELTGVSTPYGRKCNMELVRIDRNKKKTVVIDFGTTYL